MDNIFPIKSFSTTEQHSIWGFLCANIWKTTSVSDILHLSPWFCSVIPEGKAYSLRKANTLLEKVKPAVSTVYQNSTVAVGHWDSLPSHRPLAFCKGSASVLIWCWGESTWRHAHLEGQATELEHKNCSAYNDQKVQGTQNHMKAFPMSLPKITNFQSLPKTSLNFSWLSPLKKRFSALFSHLQVSYILHTLLLLLLSRFIRVQLCATP